VRSRTRHSACADDRNGVSSTRATANPRGGRAGTPSYRSRIERHTRRGTHRLTVAFRAVSALGALCIAAAGLAAVFGLAAPPSAAHGVVRTGAAEPGLVAAIRLVPQSQAGPLLVPNAMWLAEATDAASGKALGSSGDVAVRQPAPKAPPIAVTPAGGGSALASAAGAAGAAGAVKLRSRGTVTIETFGYSFDGAPGGSEFTADVRNIPTEGFDFRQDENGLMPSVRERVMSTAEANTWLSVMRNRWIPELDDGEQVAIGCSRGHHRSVTLAVLLAEDLRAAGFTVNLVHRDINKTW